MNRCYFWAVLTALALSLSPAAAENAFTLTIKDHRFDPAELRVPANQAATLTVKNLDPTPEEFESKSLRIEKVIPGNSEATFTLRPLKPGRYKLRTRIDGREKASAFTIEPGKVSAIIQAN